MLSETNSSFSLCLALFLTWQDPPALLALQIQVLVVYNIVAIVPYTTSWRQGATEFWCYYEALAAPTNVNDHDYGDDYDDDRFASSTIP